MIRGARYASGVAPTPQPPPGSIVDKDSDDSYIGAPEPVYEPDGKPGATGAELDAIIKAGNLPPVPRPA